MKISQWFGSEQKPYLGRIWLLFFIYPLFLALVVQLVLLPLIFPAWHAENGILTGGDSANFQQIAENLAFRIQTQGWSAWELRPLGQAPAGIAAFFYSLTVPKPYVLIPLNAILHATATLVLFFIIQFFLLDWRKTFLTILPFWLYPSAMIWYAQIHKDGYFILGILLWLYGWVRFSQLQTWDKTWWRGIIAAAWAFLGAGLVWLVRPYGVQMMQGVSIGLAFIITVFFIVCLVKKKLKWNTVILTIAIPWSVILLITPFTHGGIEAEIPQMELSSSKSLQQSPSSPSIGNQPQLEWLPTGWPDIIENRSYALAVTRNGFPTYFPDASSNIDLQVQFHKVQDLIAYLPRATVITFLAPFPNEWFKQGSLSQNTTMRRVAGFEMIGIYFCLALLIYAIWHWRRKPELWIVFTFCTGMMLIYGLVVANVGTLYRFRYGFIMTLVALGLAGGFSIPKRLLGRK